MHAIAARRSLKFATRSFIGVLLSVSHTLPWFMMTLQGFHFNIKRYVWASSKWSRPGGHIFCKGLYRETLTESTRHTALIFSMKWACHFRQCGILTSVDSDEPVQPPVEPRNSKWCLISSLSHVILKRLAKALIRLRVCAGWSEPLLVAHTALLEIPCHGSNST